MLSAYRGSQPDQPHVFLLYFSNCSMVSPWDVAILSHQSSCHTT